MAKKKLSGITILGPEKELKPCLEKLFINKDFVVSNAIRTFEGNKRLFSLGSANPYEEELIKLKELLNLMNIEEKSVSFSKELKFKELHESTNKLLQEENELHDEMEKIETFLAHDMTAIEELSHFKSFNIELNRLFNLKYVKFRFGYIKEALFDEVLEKIKERQDTYLLASGNTSELIYCGYFVLQNAAAGVDLLFNDFGFKRIKIEIKEDGDDKNTIDELAKKLEIERENGKIRLEEIKSILAEHEKEREKLLEYYSWLSHESSLRKIQENVGLRNKQFYITGHIPRKKALDFLNDWEKNPNLSVFISQDPKKKSKRKKEGGNKIFHMFS